MNLREAAQQALEEWHTDPGSVRMASLMMSLRAALAEPRKHISYVCPQCHWTLDTNPVDDTALLRQAWEALRNDDIQQRMKAITALRERLGDKT